jgi:hypothetical protein
MFLELFATTRRCVERGAQAHSSCVKQESALEGGANTRRTGDGFFALPSVEERQRDRNAGDVSNPQTVVRIEEVCA